MRRIGLVTVGRSDYGIYRPLLQALNSDPDITLGVYVSGMHLSPEHGNTVEMVEADGWLIADRIEMSLSGDTPQAISKSIGLGVAGFGQAFSRSKPDLLVVLGDRYETLSAVIAAMPFKIPVAHLHGGEATFGAFDEGIRHSITKMSHIHFPAAQEYADRIIQLGEEPWRVHNVGALSQDNIRMIPLKSREELEEMYGFDLSQAPLLVTFHPVTLEYEKAEEQCMALLDALHEACYPVVFTLANADTNGRLLNEMIQAYVMTHREAHLVDNFGIVNYMSMLKQARAMVGNSSSGIIEAPGFGLPVVNIGARQDGRIRGINVIDVAPDKASILSGIEKACSAEFRSSIQGAPNPYGDGHTAERIVSILKSVELDDKLIVKRFHDLKS